MFSWFSQNFIWIQITSMIISAVLLVFIIRLMIKIDFFAERRQYGSEIRHLSDLRKRKLSQLWKNVLKRIAQPVPSLWKESVFEVDAFFDDTLKAYGYLGSNEEERMDKVDSENISNIKKISEIHLEIIKLKGDDNLPLDKEKAKEYLREYRKAFRELGLLD